MVSCFFVFKLVFIGVCIGICVLLMVRYFLYGIYIWNLCWLLRWGMDICSDYYLFFFVYDKLLGNLYCVGVVFWFIVFGFLVLFLC